MTRIRVSHASVPGPARPSRSSVSPVRPVAGSRLSGLLCMLALLVPLGLLACGAQRDLDADLDLPLDPTNNEDCESGQLRCETGVRKVCSRGHWRIKNTCLGAQVCDARLGCVECSPNLPKQCDGDSIRACLPEGSFGPVERTCDPGMCKGGTCINSCGENADLVYLVDDRYRLLSFNPKGDLNELKLLGNLDCPAGRSFDGGTATPFSMSVDRDARAWVLYNSGEIFWVSTKDLSCKASGFLPGQMGFETFGMGFVSDVAGGGEETLFITGGSHLDPGKGRLGSVDKSTLKVTPIGQLPTTEYGPELTGTGKAELWAYFPGSMDTFVARMDKTTGMPASRSPMPPLDGSVRAWAFAHWGGRFYLFVTTLDFMTGRNNSRVFRFTPDDGRVEEILSNLPYNIVGAGVSTCAPIVIG